MGYDDNDIGYQSQDTSRQAARHNAEGKVTLRDQVRQLFNYNDNLTVVDVCRMLGREKISVQPRVTELKNENFLEDSGLRKTGPYGTNIIVWRKVK